MVLVQVSSIVGTTGGFYFLLRSLVESNYGFILYIDYD